ncbi:Hypothetical_protein [Hexamita inflata]|uniref:Hypothetical_protein n=1 Tax=Hexamita inflata TaxID=28002 RepID=A0AA86PHL8_9EUKA|nr:Hypothetical protein HINF_LOCUS25013 [Hexamita inflata]
MFHVFNCRRYSEPVRSSVALDFAFLPCSHTLEAQRRSRCPSSGSLTVSLTLLRRDGAFMQSISDQAGVMQFGFFVSARHCKAAVFAQECSLEIIIISIIINYNLMTPQIINTENIESFMYRSKERVKMKISFQNVSCD